MPGGFMDEEDIHMADGGHPFGGGAGRGGSFGSRPKRSPVATRNLPCTLEELYTGTTKKLKVTRRRGGRSDEKILSVTVKAGWKPGTKITFTGEGDEPAMGGGTPQDIVFVIAEKPHAVFTRKDNDLQVSLNLSLKEALCGFDRTIRTLDGRTLKVPDTLGVISPGKEAKIPGEGMPISKKPGQKGDLRIKFSVEFPRGPLSSSQKDAIRQALP